MKNHFPISHFGFFLMFCGFAHFAYHCALSAANKHFEVCSRYEALPIATSKQDINPPPFAGISMLSCFFSYCTRLWSIVSHESSICSKLCCLVWCLAQFFCRCTFSSKQKIPQAAKLCPLPHGVCMQRHRCRAACAQKEGESVVPTCTEHAEEALCLLKSCLWTLFQKQWFAQTILRAFELGFFCAFVQGRNIAPLKMPSGLCVCNV